MRQRILLRTAYWAGFLFSLHVALTVYINSSYLASNVSENMVGILYTLAAVVSVLGLFLVPKLINRFGTSKIIGMLIAINILNLVGMIIAPDLYVLGACFVLYFAFNTLIYLGIDIMIEHWSKNADQGTVRGSYLTANNFGFMIAPLIAGFVVDRLGFQTLYGFGIVILIPVLIIIGFQLPTVNHTHPSRSNIFMIARKFLKNRKLRAVFTINFILQFFYAWMVIYTPIFLHVNAGIPWDSLGFAFTIMLAAFVLFEYPVGKLIDGHVSERTIMLLGLLIAGVSTLLVTRAPIVTFWALIATLFVTRVGASMIEVASESYFFRHVDHEDTGSIGFFRNTYPFAYLLAPLLGSVMIGIAPLWSLFVVLGGICFLGMIVVIRMQRRVR